MYSEKATKFCEIFILLLSYVVPVKSKVKTSQNFVAFSEYMNFKRLKILDILYLRDLLVPFFKSTLFPCPFPNFTILSSLPQFMNFSCFPNIILIFDNLIHLSSSHIFASKRLTVRSRNLH